MKKKIALIAACLMLLSSTAFASPLTDYSQGKASIDLNFRNAKNTLYGDNSESLTFDKKYNIEPSVTIGLGVDWAFQYRNVNSKSATTTIYFPGVHKAHSLLTINEFNVLHKLGENSSVFAGVVSTKGTIEVDLSAIQDKRTTWQVGILGSVPLADKVAAYGVVGLGNKWANYEIGLSYVFTKNLEFNLDYRYIKTKDFEDSLKYDAQMKGIGFGLTYKL